MPLTALLWIILAVYAAIMIRIAPRARSTGEFFGGRSGEGRDVGTGMLVATVVISWIFAKSITNAANLGASYGLVGAVAYAGWYLSIPVAGIVIYLIRTRLGSKSLSEFLASRYGRAATYAFLLAVLIRLMNEVWSNTAVVGAYFGASGTASYFAGALAFTGITLAYGLRGGLRGSILTDLLQFGLGAFLLVFVLALLVPRSGAAPLLTSGTWTLAGGVDLLLVALLQSFSYPFHDPVLTDRAFITRPGPMLRGYLIAGLVAAVFIVLFGLTGVYARVAGIEAGQDAPLQVAHAFGVAMTAVMTVLMMVSAGSTLDSTFSSFARATVYDLDARDPLREATRGWLRGADPIRVGRHAMLVAAVLGSIPLFTGAAIIKATTVSGTMVLGLAPPFMLFGWRRARGLAFHLGFWPGVMIGVLHAINLLPASWAIGDGPYAALLGANVAGTALCFGGFALGALLAPVLSKTPQAVARAAVLLALAGAAALAPAPARASAAADSTQAPPRPTLGFGGQTMLRYTLRLDDPERPAAEVYNVRGMLDGAQGAYRFRAEARARQTKLRSYSPSNVWLQQAWGAWTSPATGFTVATGLLYNQLGLFWDDSWFGNLPYLNGHKLDPDMNLEIALDRALGDRAGIKAWLQLSPGEDGLNGTFATAEKAKRLPLPADPEVETNFREALAVRARVVPSLQVGALRFEPGVSVERSTFDRTADTSFAAATGHRVTAGAELTLVLPRGRVFGEVLRERMTGLPPGEVTRRYVLAGFEAPLWREAGTPRAVTAGASWQRADYDEAAFHEWFVTARLHARLGALAGVTAEYVRWQLSGGGGPQLDRVELIVHLYY